MFWSEAGITIVSVAPLTIVTDWCAGPVAKFATARELAGAVLRARRTMAPMLATSRRGRSRGMAQWIAKSSVKATTPRALTMAMRPVPGLLAPKIAVQVPSLFWVAPLTFVR